MHSRTTTHAVMAAFVAALIASPSFAQNPQSSTMGQQRPNEGVGSSARMPATTGTGAAQGVTDPGATQGLAPGSASAPGGTGTAGASSTGQTTTNRALQEQGGAATSTPTPIPNRNAGTTPAATGAGTGGTPGSAAGQPSLTQGTAGTSPSAMGVTDEQRRMGQSSGRQGLSDGAPSSQVNDGRGVGPALGTPMIQPPGSTVQSGAGSTTATGDQRGGTNTGSVVPGRDAATQDANAPIPGANSYTEGQARARAEGRGFTDVGEMTKDDNGIWRGRARQGGRSVEVMVDFQGNVVGR